MYGILNKMTRKLLLRNSSGQKTVVCYANQLRVIYPAKPDFQTEKEIKLREGVSAGPALPDMSKEVLRGEMKGHQRVPPNHVTAAPQKACTHHDAGDLRAASTFCESSTQTSACRGSRLRHHCFRVWSKDKPAWC